MRIYLLITSLILSFDVLAHSGRTDASGGHWNHSTGVYHYHTPRFDSQIKSKNITRFSDENALFKLTSVIEIDNQKYQFAHITTAKIDSLVSFKINSSKDVSLDVEYICNGVRLNQLSIELLTNRDSFLPSREKGIILSESGTHEFIFRAGNQVERVNVVVESGIKKFSFPETDLTADVEITVPAVFADLEEYKGVVTKDIKLPQEESTRATGSELYKTLSESVVLITTEKGSGSGSVISKDGKILTNEHVVDGQMEVQINFKPAKFTKVSSREALIADVIKVDESMDLALLQLRSPLPPALNIIALGEIEDIEIADDVHAIGHPHGYHWTYTKGVISQLRADFEWGDEEIINKADVIQTQTPINPGNSGGPLLNNDMRLIGVNSFGMTGAQGLNYAVSVTSIRKFLKQPQKFKSAEKRKRSPDISKGIEMDWDEDGETEIILALDQNKNGIVEAVYIDWDKDGEVDLALLDENENYEVEVSVELLKTPEHPYIKETIIIKIDEDEDGDWDAASFDFHADGEIDKVERL